MITEQRSPCALCPCGRAPIHSGLPEDATYQRCTECGLLSLSLRATLYRLLQHFSDGRAVANVVTLAADGMVLAVMARTLPRSIPSGSPMLHWSWGLGLTAVLLVSPLVEEHHLVVLLLPLMLLLTQEWSSPAMGRQDVWLLIGTIVLLASPYSLEAFPAIHSGFPSLLMTGKLLGVAGLAWLLLRRIKESTAMTSRTAPPATAPGTADPDDSASRSQVGESREAVRG